MNTVHHINLAKRQIFMAFQGMSIFLIQPRRLLR